MSLPVSSRRRAVASDVPTTRRFIPQRETCRRVGKSRWWLREEILAGRFPKPIIIGGRNMFVEDEIDTYIASLIARRDQQAA
jgi:predicted DNA-binding transcriptional regulator AlpA